VAREAGFRSKIAVVARDVNVDPVGACVGQKGSRVQQVVGELKGEKIDIVAWDPDVTRFIANSLSPARVTTVFPNEAQKVARVVVPDNQLSLAIGKEGQNARLAARLTGWKIDIKSESQMADILEEELFEAAPPVEEEAPAPVTEPELAETPVEEPVQPFEEPAQPVEEPAEAEVTKAAEVLDKDLLDELVAQLLGGGGLADLALDQKIDEPKRDAAKKKAGAKRPAPKAAKKESTVLKDLAALESLLDGTEPQGEQPPADEAEAAEAVQAEAEPKAKRKSKKAADEASE
jgi:transcription antitermination factor NusA-like protein